MNSKFPVLNTLITVQNVSAIILAVIGILFLVVGLIDDTGIAFIQIGIGLALLVVSLVMRLGVEISRVFLEIEKNTRKEEPDVDASEILK